MTDRNNRSHVAEIVLVILSGVAALPLLYILAMELKLSFIPEEIHEYAVFLHEPTTAVVFAILFALGVLLLIKVERPIFLIPLLPFLAFAVWPVFVNDEQELAVPKGAIVAFDQVFHRDGATFSCPIGWAEVEGLAGRMPLGVGSSSEAASNHSIGDADAGAETVSLGRLEIPGHQHNYRDIFYSANPGQSHGAPEMPTSSHTGNKGSGPDANNVGFYDTRPTNADSRISNAHNNMPPFHVVQFCRRK